MCEPGGTSSTSSTKIAPLFSSSVTTWMLCTICLRTYTGAPYCSMAFSTAMTARSTPAQYPRGAASSTRLLPTTGSSVNRARRSGTIGVLTGAPLVMVLTGPSLGAGP